MESLRIVPDLEVQGFEDGHHIVESHKGPIVIGGMPRGTESGNPSVMIAFEMDDGYLVAETTLALFLEAADVLKAKHGDPRA